MGQIRYMDNKEYKYFIQIKKSWTGLLGALLLVASAKDSRRCPCKHKSVAGEKTSAIIIFFFFLKMEKGYNLRRCLFKQIHPLFFMLVAVTGGKCVG